MTGVNNNKNFKLKILLEYSFINKFNKINKKKKRIPNS